MEAVEVARAVAGELANAGSTHMFGIPGGGNNLELIGAAERAGIQFVLAHSETAAAIMAAIFADLTRTPAACVVTRGPGAASTINGAAQAFLDRQPLLLLTDAVGRDSAHRISHQQLDQNALFAPVTKAAGVVGRGCPDAVVRRSIEISRVHPAGPVQLDFDPASVSGIVPHRQRQKPPVREQDLEQLDLLLASAELPVIVLGVGARALADKVRSLVEGTRIPVLCTYRAKGLVPESSANFAGMMTGADVESPVLEAADLIVLVGVDAVEFIPNSWLYTVPVVALGEWAEESEYLTPQLELVGPLDELLERLARGIRDGWQSGFAVSHRHRAATALRADQSDALGASPQDVVLRTRRAAPSDTVITVDAGAHMLAAMHLWATDVVDGALISSGLATMGFALPAAIAAALAWPSRRIICFVGDGGLGMSLAEMETLSRYELDVTVVVFNDSALSLIEIKGDPAEHGMPNSVEYGRTSFAGAAESMGVTARQATDGPQLSAALDELLTVAGPSLIDVKVDPAGYPALMAAIRSSRPQSAVVDEPERLRGDSTAIS